jgi:hypothetical protein
MMSDTTRDPVEQHPDDPNRDDPTRDRDRGLGSEGTIPDDPGSVGVGAGEPTTFEPEEDPEAAANRDENAPT